jgi:predicted MFS family arabinose efflux permease
MGILAASAGLPRLLLGFVAGAWVNRLRRKPIMIATDIGRALAIATIPIAALIGMESLALLVAVQLMAGLCSIFFQAAWAPYLPGLVGRTNLPSANSKILGSASVAQVAGPSLAGTLIDVIGAPFTFLIDALSYLWSAVFIASIEHVEPPPRPPEDDRSIVREIRQGIQVLVSSPILRALTGNEATIVLGGYIFLAIYPLFKVESLGLSAQGVGLVYAAGGIGGLAGSLVTTSIVRKLGTGPTIVWSATLFGVFGVAVPLAVFVTEYALPLVVFAEFAQWMMLVVSNVTSGSLRQSLTPDHLLGRVVASDQVLGSGLQPVGAFMGGVLGQIFGVHTALLIGVAGMFLAGWWVFRSPVREIREMPTEPDHTLDRSISPNAS